MDTLVRFLENKMSVQEFGSALKGDPALREEIRNIIPAAARKDPLHPYWEKHSFDALRRYDFDCLNLLQDICHFDGTLGDDLNVYGTLRNYYSAEHPDLAYTDEYTDRFRLYLDAIGEYLEGPEVNHLISRLVQEAYDAAATKTARRKLAREKLRSAFHIEGRKYPHWIQDAEWPCGVDSPMRFLSQQRQGERTVYRFQDVKTGDIREIEQYY